MSRNDDDVARALAALAGAGDGSDTARSVGEAARRAGQARLQALAAELARARRAHAENEGDGQATGARPVEVIVEDIRRLRARLGEPPHHPTDSPSLRDSDAPE